MTRFDSILEPLWQTKKTAITLLIVAATVLALHMLSYSFVSDDAYITFRYSWNLAFHGDISFNLGERVEGYTNFLWMAILAFFLKLGLRPDVMSQILGTLFGIGSLILIFVLTRLYRGGKRRGWDYFGALLLPAIPSFAIWCTGGLETQLFSFLILGGITAYYAESSGRITMRYSGGLFALAAMTRPEGLLIFALTGLHRLARNIIVEKRLIPQRQEWIWVLGFIIPFGLFFLWRYSYYGYPFPNTYYVKAGGDHLQALTKWGLPYLWDFIHLNRLYLILPFALFFWPKTSWDRVIAKAFFAAKLKAIKTKVVHRVDDDWLASEKPILGNEEEPETATHENASEELAPELIERENDQVEEAADERNVYPDTATLRPSFLWSYLALIVFPFGFYVCWVGGDFMANGRFLLPMLPLIVIFGQEAIRESTRRLKTYQAPALALLMIAIFIGAAFNARWVHQINTKMSYRRWGLDTVAYLRKFADDRIKVGNWLRKHLPKESYLSVGGAGAIVYASRLKALDSFGLNEAWVAHHMPNTGHRPGHSKHASLSYILKNKPDLMCHHAHHQNGIYRPRASEAAMWRHRGYRWVCVDAPKLRPTHYCCLKRIKADISVWPEESSP